MRVIVSSSPSLPGAGSSLKKADPDFSVLGSPPEREALRFDRKRLGAAPMFHRHDRILTEGKAVDGLQKLIVPPELVRRIGVNEIALPRAEPAGYHDRIGCDRGDGDPEGVRCLRNQLHVVTRLVDRCRGSGTARDGLEGKDAASCEEIEEARSGDSRADDVEVRLPGAFGSGADVAPRNWNAAAPERAGSDPERSRALRRSRYLGRPTK